MSLANAIYMNILCLAVLGFVLGSSRVKAENTSLQHRLFTAIVFSTMATLVLDIFGRAFDGLNTPAFTCLNWASNMALFIFTPLTPCIWMLFADYQVNHDEKRLRAYILPLSLFLLLITAVSISTVRTGWLFTINGKNIYRRGPLQLAHACSCYAIQLYTTCYILIKRKKIARNHFVALLIFPLPTAIGGALQSLFYGTSLVGCGLTLSVLMIYINIQDRRLHTDYLTGIYNRRLLGNYIEEKIKAGAKGRTFSALLIDLDGFKQINDSFGHTIGDSALLDAVNLLQSCLRQSDFVSRYGGDEFLVILDIDSPFVLEGTVQRVRHCFKKFNQHSAKPYQLKFSSGYAVYDMASGIGPEQFIKHVDTLMYEDKKRAKV